MARITLMGPGAIGGTMAGMRCGAQRACSRARDSEDYLGPSRSIPERRRRKTAPTSSNRVLTGWAWNGDCSQNRLVSPQPLAAPLVESDRHAVFPDPVY